VGEDVVITYEELEEHVKDLTEKEWTYLSAEFQLQCRFVSLLSRSVFVVLCVGFVFFYILYATVRNVT
jgi:hypothetical protein